MASALDRLKAAHQAKGPAAPATPAAAVVQASPAVVAQPQTVQQAAIPQTQQPGSILNLAAAAAASAPLPAAAPVQQPAQQAAPVQQAAPAVQAVPVVQAVVEPAPQQAARFEQPLAQPLPGQAIVPNNIMLPQTIETQQDARNALSAILGISSVTNNTTMNEALASLDQGGMSLEQPFARCVKGNWSVLKNMDPEIYEFMPMGDRPYRGIYLGYRFGVVGWKGAPPAAGGGGSAPAFKFVIPDTFYHPEYNDTFAGMMHIANRIQFTKTENRIKFDVAGRLSPEIQILVWTPNTGFIVLVSVNYSQAKLTFDNLKETKIHPGFAYRFEPAAETVVNKKADKGAKNEQWENWWIKATADVTPEGAVLIKEFKDFVNRDEIGTAKAITAFVEGSDFKGGLDFKQVNEKLIEYGPILAQK